MNRTRIARGISTVLLIIPTLAAPSRADSWEAPFPAIHASERGRYAVKVIPEKIFNARAEAVSIDKEGNVTSHWKMPLACMPVSVYVADFAPIVVALDMFHQTGQEHTLVVYGRDGKVLADYALEDLLTKEEIEKHTFRTISSRWWRHDATTEFHYSTDPNAPTQAAFIMRFKWGKVIRVDLLTGNVMFPEAKPAEAPAAAPASAPTTTAK